MFFFRDTGHSIDRTYLGAYLAPDTRIQYKGLLPPRYEIGNRLCRTLRDTETAYSAFVDIYPRQIIFDGWCVKGTYLCADPARNTANLAILSRIHPSVS